MCVKFRRTKGWLKNGGKKRNSEGAVRKLIWIRNTWGHMTGNRK